ncbi:MAG: sugar ABC transporter permease [Clostridia bacterium]|nr:sugar ABC transporter permease [Clostridia bacterium]
MFNKKGKRSISLESKKAMSGYVFVAPFVIGFIFIFFSSFIFFIAMAFSEQGMSNEGMVLEFCGLKNYEELFLSNMEYVKSVFASLGSLLIRLPSVLLFSFMLAVVLNQQFKGRGLVRAVFFLPVVVASGIAASTGNSGGLLDNAQMMLQGMMGDDTGAQNITESIISLFGEGSYGSVLIEGVAAVVAGIYDIAQASGVQILIFLAALQTIPSSLYEASYMDGATGWENFWKITLPMISPMLLVNAVYTVIDALVGADNAVVTMVYNMGAKQTNYTMSAAMGLLYFVVVVVVIGLLMWGLSRLVYYEDN